MNKSAEPFRTDTLYVAPEFEIDSTNKVSYKNMVTLCFAAGAYRIRSFHDEPVLCPNDTQYEFYPLRYIQPLNAESELNHDTWEELAARWNDNAN